MRLCIFLLLVCACGGAPTPVENKPMPIPDSGSEVITTPDAKVEDSHIEHYNACATKVLKITSYPRLQEIICTDSNGNTFSSGYLDSDLKMECRWGRAADLKIRCLPKNKQSAPQFADYYCTYPIGLMAVGSAPYIGIDTMSGNNSWVVVYEAGDLWKDTGTMYYMASYQGEWNCYPTYLKFPGAEVHYLGKEVPASTFVEQ